MKWFSAETTDTTTSIPSWHAKSVVVLRLSRSSPGIQEQFRGRTSVSEIEPQHMLRVILVSDNLCFCGWRLSHRCVHLGDSRWRIFKLRYQGRGRGGWAAGSQFKVQSENLEVVGWDEGFALISMHLFLGIVLRSITAQPGRYIQFWPPSLRVPHENVAVPRVLANLDHTDPKTSAWDQGQLLWECQAGQQPTRSNQPISSNCLGGSYLASYRPATTRESMRCDLECLNQCFAELL